MNSETKNCQNCKSDFTIEPDDFGFYEKIKVPAPTWCPKCRFQRRLSSYNVRSLYRRVCDLCGKNVISIYSPDKKITVYCNPCWWSDKWDAMTYGRAYDPRRPFLAQLKELDEAIPYHALEVNYPTLVNSDYVNATGTAKNCYLIYVADECENVLYSEILLHNKDSMDGTMFGGSELCYEITNSGSCSKVFFSDDCSSCHDIYFSKDLIGCSDCFGCIGLRSKSYYIFNQPYTKEVYQEKLASFGLDSYRNIEAFKEKSLEFWQKYPNKFAHILRNVNVTGDYTYSSKNSKNMYLIHEKVEDSRYCQILTMPSVKDAYDYTLWGNNANGIYECSIVGEGASNIKFGYQVWGNVRDIEYSIQTMSSSYLFGCAKVRNKQYCILNKQYSKESYEILKAQIIKDMCDRPFSDAKGRAYPYGEFFPSELSVYGYNETYAMDFFPLTAEEAKAQGFAWYEEKVSPHVPTLLAKNLPDSITEVTDTICDEIIECLTCKKAFRIVPTELAMLRRFRFPLPRKCPNCRYKRRFSTINPPFLCHRACQCMGMESKNKVYKNSVIHIHGSEPCPIEFETSYAPDRQEIVYCEQCYQAEVA